MTIITRSALVHWGHNPAPEVAGVVTEWNGERRVITWDDVMRERRDTTTWICSTAWNRSGR